MCVVIGCIVFYLAYLQWFAWFALICVLCLPIAALLMSLPAMLDLKLAANSPASVPVGEKQKFMVMVRNRFPAPVCTYRFRVTRATTGESWVMKKDTELPTDHCGKLVCKFEKARVYDYLGLFHIRITKAAPLTVAVFPRPVPMKQSIPDLERYLATAWRPKAGGGFSENHEMRLYRPGDNLNQVHWKLTAKTGKIIIREAMEPDRRRVLLEMELQGTPEELDRKLGRLLWLSGHLLETGIHHELRVLTGKGLWCCKVTNEQELHAGMDALLGQSVCRPGESLEPAQASWSCRIGGEADEP